MESPLDRRSAIRKVSYLVGGAVATPTLLSIMQSCEQAPPPLNWKSEFLDENQARLLSEVAELILPETSTPGAKEIGVPYFMDTMLQQCLEPQAQSMFLEGLTRIQQFAQEGHTKDFLDLEPAQQQEVLTQIAKEDYAPKSESDSKIPKPFFKQFKELALLGYFNSEVGAKEALAYLQIPGAYDGCTTLAPNQKAWAL